MDQIKHLLVIAVLVLSDSVILERLWRTAAALV